ncbi:long-chain fatty acid--CoA ligase [Phenylobacterium sp.]|uniref:long-chain fatty acid--CoA ligase n=1 Tax=Phenylobacterium sp. TaxID=1871053 RepID=UPI0027350268|nr:long-chain fatty acid--CoA ligase [Phenylobacterium sp.]MDP3659497.1 long-chain fatty acid--CoA ligase [Phenylobacterium sp.]
MHALMMDRPLTLPSILEYAAQYHGEREIVTRTLEGPIHRYGYADALARAKRMANALTAMGVGPGDRVATLAWSTYRHFELYYAVSGIGAILHTINPRLFPDQVAWIANHAEDSVLLYDPGFEDLSDLLAAKVPSLKTRVVMCDAANRPAGTPADVLNYEDLIDANSPEFIWPDIDERMASALCYTSGTTGNPKGVLYGHRSTVLHSLAVRAPDIYDVAQRDVILPCAQLYHANAWCIPYVGPMAGAKIVFPGRFLDGPSVCELAIAEKVTFILGVPIIFQGMLDHLDATGQEITTLRTLIVGGSAPTPALIRRVESKLNVSIRQGWGMTEMSPNGVMNTPLHSHADMAADDVIARKQKAGRAQWGVDLRIVDDEDNELPRDGVTPGRLQVKGPWIASSYFKGDGPAAFTADGWFDTGDVGALDPEGYLRLTDRAKDVIKSGGEWISSLDLENACSTHPAVALSAAIGVYHPKWDERPLLLVMLKPGAAATPDEIKDHVAAQVAKWWIPDEVRIVETLPIGPTGKVMKRELRDQIGAETPLKVTQG